MDKLFPTKTKSNPQIYAYQDLYNPHLKGLLKVGYTTIDPIIRVQQQYNIAKPGGAPYRIVFTESAMRQDGTTFDDHEVHRMLERAGITRVEGEWFRCSLTDVKVAWLAVRDRRDTIYARTETFSMRPEQQAAVDKTAAYFKRYKDEPGHTPHFLWNYKMRFGKTFTTYQLARKMGWHRLLVLTFKPAVAQAWEEDLMSYQDFGGWKFLNAKYQIDKDIDSSKPFVCFGSFQDFLGKSKNGGMKAKHEWTRTFNWDCVVLDEYHYGAWRDDAQELSGSRENAKEQKDNNKELAAELENPDPLHCKTITLSCGKLTTGVTIKPWTGIFMLRDTSSLETYFQAAFRVQSPWTITNPDGLSPNYTEILKKECYVFDFSPNRALRKMAEYSSQLNVDERKSPEEKVDDLLRFLPVLCYQDGAMKQLNAGEVLDMATSNTSATLLARRWESATLVNVTNGVLEKLLNNEQAMAALMSLEGFRSLNEDIQTISNKTDKIKKTKREMVNEEMTKKQKKKLSDEEKVGLWSTTISKDELYSEL